MISLYLHIYIRCVCVCENVNLSVCLPQSVSLCVYSCMSASVLVKVTPIAKACLF